MTISLNKRLSKFVMLFGLVSHSFASSRCEAKESAMLLSKGRADTAHIDSKQLPPGSVFELDVEKKFSLNAQGNADLQVVTLGINVNAPARVHSECGVYFSGPGGADRYVPIQGQQPADDMCDGIRAVGLLKEPGPDRA